MRKDTPRRALTRSVAVTLGVVGLALLALLLGAAPAWAASPMRDRLPQGKRTNPVEQGRELSQITGEEHPAVVARVGDQPISGKALARQIHIVRHSQTPGIDKTNPVRTALDQLVEREVLMQAAAARGIAVGDAEVRAFAESQQQLAQAGNPQAKEALALYMAQVGVTPEEYATNPAVLEQYRRMLVLSQIRGQIAGTLPAERRADPAAQRAAINEFVARSGVSVEVLIRP